MRKRSEAEVRRLAAASDSVSGRAYPARAHHIFQYLDLVVAAGADGRAEAPCLVVAEEEVTEVRDRFLRGNAPDVQWLGMNAGAAYGPAKRWPMERFVQAATAIHRQTACGWLVFGGGRDTPETAEIARRLAGAGVSPVLDLAGKTTLRQLCALFRLCEAVVTNDSGPMHVAAAVGVPVVALFGSTSPELTGPAIAETAAWKTHVVVRTATPCAPCFRRDCPIDLRCLRGIATERVVEAVLAVMARTPRRTGTGY